MATRVKKISSSLQEVKDSHRFLKVSMKDGKYSVNSVQISGHKATWDKNPKIVYSPETGLAGVEGDIIDYLKSRSDRNDDSATDVLLRFEKDRLITSTNHKEFIDYIDTITMNQQEKSKASKGSASAVTAKMILVDRMLIPDLLTHVREVRNQTGVSGKSSKTNIIQSYLDTVRGTDKVYRIHGCDSSGKTGDSKLRTAERESLSKTTIPLADSGDLSYFFIPASYDEKRFVINFMTLYFAHVDGLKPTEASTKARSFAEDLLSQYKKGGRSGRKSSPSHKSRSSSRSMSRDASLKAKRSSSTKSHASVRERSVSRSRALSVPSRSPSVSPKRHASVHHPSKSPVRSASPGTSPSQATTTKRFRLPVKTKTTA